MAHERTRVFIGNDASGKPKYSQISGKNQDERNDNIVLKYIETGRIWELMNADELNRYLPRPPEPPKHPFSEYAWTWYRRYKQGYTEENTRYCIQYAIRSHERFFGNTPIESITVNDIQDYFNSLKHLSKVTIKGHKTFLTQIFDSAVEDEIITKNPVRSQRLMNPGRESKGVHALPVEAMIDIMEGIERMPDPSEAIYIALAFYAGLRREEVLGLQWEDIDFRAKRLHIQRAIAYPINQPIIKPPKTKSGNRIIAIPDPLYELLKPHEGKSGFVLLDEGGILFTQERLKIFARNVNSHINLHGAGMRELRKCFATIRHAAGTPDKLLQTEIGHASYSTTQSFYINTEVSQMEEYRNAMVLYLTRKKEQFAQHFVQCSSENGD